MKSLAPNNPEQPTIPGAPSAPSAHRFQFGDIVVVDIDDREPDPTPRWIIGEAPYSEARNQVVVVATEAWIGMPVSQKWCTSVSPRDEETAERLRARFEAHSPRWMKALPSVGALRSAGNCSNDQSILNKKAAP